MVPLNNHGDITQPCLNITLTRNHSLASFSTQTHALHLHKILHCFEQFSCNSIPSNLPHPMPIACIICLFQIQKRPEYTFPICGILFTHLPYDKHLVHAPSTLPTLLLPYCTFSSSPNSFNQHST